jgi:hypothetical protein
LAGGGGRDPTWASGLPLPPAHLSRGSGAAGSRFPLPALRRSWPLAGGGSPLRLAGSRVEGDPPVSVDPLRAACRHLYPRGHLCCSDPSPAGVGGVGGKRAGADAGGPVSRRAQLGLRRRLPLRGADQLWRSGRLQSPSQCLPPTGFGRHLGCGLQPPGAGGELPAGFWPLLHHQVPHPLGSSPQLRRLPFRWGTGIFPAKCRVLARGISPGWAAPGCRSRHLRLQRLPLLAGIGRAGGCPRSSHWPAQGSHCRKRPQRCPPHHPPRARGLRARCPVVR